MRGNIIGRVRKPWCDEDVDLILGRFCVTYARTGQTKALYKHAVSMKNFMAFPPSSKRIILEWIAKAKTEATRTKRINETVAKAKENLRANHYCQAKTPKNKP